MARNSLTRHPLKSSERQPLRGARAVGKADPAERLEVTILLRRRNGGVLTERVKKLAKRQDVGGHLSRSSMSSSAPTLPTSRRSGNLQRRTASRLYRSMQGGARSSCRAQWRSSMPRSV
jgi:hypothetical protein